MRTMIRRTSLLVASSLTLIGCASDRVQGSGDKSMSFFVTSASPETAQKNRKSKDTPSRGDDSTLLALGLSS